MGVSVVTVLPQQSPWWPLHYVAAAWLVFSIAFHYAATLCRDPGLLTFRCCDDFLGQSLEACGALLGALCSCSQFARGLPVSRSSTIDQAVNVHLNNYAGAARMHAAFLALPRTNVQKFGAHIWGIQSSGVIFVGMVRGGMAPAKQVQPGTMDDYTFCSKCNAAKPPTAHHCR